VLETSVTTIWPTATAEVAASTAVGVTIKGNCGVCGTVTLKPPSNTAANSRAITAPMVAASGKCFQKPTRMLSILTSNIITTKRNNTITAPTYTKTSAIDKNSASNNIHKPDAWKKANTR
jgi:hypothetical protein